MLTDNEFIVFIHRIQDSIFHQKQNFTLTPKIFRSNIEGYGEAKQLATYDPTLSYCWFLTQCASWIWAFPKYDFMFSLIFPIFFDKCWLKANLLCSFTFCIQTASSIKSRTLPWHQKYSGLTLVWALASTLLIFFMSLCKDYIHT